MDGLTYEQLDELKTQLIGKHAVAGDADRAITGAKIDLLQELMAELKPALPPEAEYYILFKCKWQPTDPFGEDPPMDHTHWLSMGDERCTTWETVAIGDAAGVRTELDRL